MSNDHLKYLLQQFAADASTPAEVRELLGWVRKSKDDTLLKAKIKELWDAHGSGGELPNVDWNAVYTKIIQTPVIRRRPVWWKYTAAAAVVLAVSTTGYFWLNRTDVQPLAHLITQSPAHDEIVPGGDKAVLTLADGTHIVLDSAGAGTLSQQGNMKIVKLSNGQVSYQFASNNATPAASGKILYNTISTPRGGQYNIVLSDGSKVWLNAASSLRFPAAFNGNERNVELTGEGYFEVAHNPAKPFRVAVNGMTVKVLGTHFNINAYSDDRDTKTTLLEGSVEVETGSQRRTIVPGEQARVSNTSGESGSTKINIRNVDVDDVVAWKNGRFIFRDDNIQAVMRQLSRWYNVSVTYEGDVTNEEFVGVINRSRYENISQILNMLERTRTVSFVVIGSHVTVKPYKPAGSAH